MKITSVQAIHVSIPFHHGGPPTGFGGRPWRNLDTILVRVETEDGLVGWGDAFCYNCAPATKAAVETMVAPLAVGRDARNIARTMTELQKLLHIFGRYGITMFALSGLDIALWDLAGKRAGRPLHELLGLTGTGRIPTYASLLRYDEPDVVHDRVSAAVAAGSRFVKLHEHAVEAVGAARAAAGDDVGIMVDVNCPWTVAESIRMADAYEPFDIYWLEEPVWPPENFHGLAELRRSHPTPIAAGENACTVWQFREMLAQNAVDWAQPSVTKVGGISEFVKIAELARVHNVQLAPHSPYFGPGFLATLHLCAAGDTSPVERFFGDPEASLFGSLIDAEDGMLTVPDAPGLGCDPDPDVIREYLVKD